MERDAKGATVSGYALAVNQGTPTVWLPRWRWGRAAMVAMVALVALAGQQPVARVVADRLPTPAASDTGEIWPAGLREAAEAARYAFDPGADGTWAATWALQQKLTASDVAIGDLFGHSVAISGNTVAVGAVADNTPAGVDAGSAYVFRRSGVTWAQQQKLTDSDGSAEDFFGISVAVSGNTVVAGAYSDDIVGNPNAGSASVFDVDNAVPTCSYTIAAGPPKRVDFTVQDTGSGIASIATLSLLNIVTPVPVPAFTAGTTAPVLFSATKDVQNQRATIAVVITDMAGNQSSCM